MIHKLITTRFVQRRSNKETRKTTNVAKNTGKVSTINQKGAPGPSPALSDHPTNASRVRRNCATNTPYLSILNKHIKWLSLQKLRTILVSPNIDSEFCKECSSKRFWGAFFVYWHYSSISGLQTSWPGKDWGLAWVKGAVARISSTLAPNFTV